MAQLAADAGALLDIGNIALFCAVSARRLELWASGKRPDEKTFKVLQRMRQILEEASDDVEAVASQTLHQEMSYRAEVLQIIVRALVPDSERVSDAGARLVEVSRSIEAAMAGEQREIPGLVCTLRKLSDSATSFGTQLSRGDTERADERQTTR